MEEGISHNIETLIYQRQTTPDTLLLPINPVLRMLLDGVFDKDSPLSIFLGAPHILQDIWNLVTKWWKKHIRFGLDLQEIEPADLDDIEQNLAEIEYYEENQVAYYKCDDEIVFPKPTDLYINMMPFYMSSEFEKSGLPEYLKSYWDNIINHLFHFGYIYRRLIDESEHGKIGYLTIHESYIKKNETQRRPGLHTDCPGKLMIAPNDDGDYFCIGRVSEDEENIVCDTLDSKFGAGFVRDKAIHWTHPWGMGMSRCECALFGGIYMASTLSESCEVYDCRVTQGENGEEIIGNLGDVEHLKDFLPQSEMLEANRMYWITDRTPHKSVPLKEGAYRQYFRLVTSNVSVWFEEHSTKNPNGVVPDPAITKVVKGSKFKSWSALID